MIFDDFREPAASAAYDIAFNFLARSGAIRDEFDAVVFLVQYLTRMVDQGHRNKILMANRAISAYQASVQQHAEQCAAQETPHVKSMEQVLRSRLGGRETDD